MGNQRLRVYNPQHGASTAQEPAHPGLLPLISPPLLCSCFMAQLKTPHLGAFLISPLPLFPTPHVTSTGDTDRMRNLDSDSKDMRLNSDPVVQSLCDLRGVTPPL